MSILFIVLLEGLNDPKFGILINIFAFFINIIASYNLTKITLKIYENHHVNFKEILDIASDKKEIKKILKWVLGQALYGLIILLGFLLFIVPGIYFAVKYNFVRYIMIEKNIGIIEAFKESAKITNGHEWQLISFSLVSFLVTFVGLILLIVGVIPAYMLILIASAYVYKKLSIHHV